MSDISPFLIGVLEEKVCPECDLGGLTMIHLLDLNDKCSNCGRDYSKLVAGYNYGDTEIREREKKSHRRIGNQKKKKY